MKFVHRLIGLNHSEQRNHLQLRWGLALSRVRVQLGMQKAITWMITQPHRTVEVTVISRKRRVVENQEPPQ